MADHTSYDMTAHLLMRQTLSANSKCLLTGILAIFCSVLIFFAPKQIMAAPIAPTSVNVVSPRESAPHHLKQADAIGMVTLALGIAEVIRADGQTQPGRKGIVLYQGDQLITRQGGHLHIRFIDNALISVRPGSHLILEAYHYDPAQPENSQVRFTLKEGVARSVSGGAAHQDYQKFRLNTPVAAIGVRGTDFTVSAQQDKVRTFVSEGAIVVAPFSDSCRSDGLGPCTASGVELKQQQQAFIELQQSSLKTELTRFALPRQPNSAMLTNERLISHVKKRAVSAAEQIAAKEVLRVPVNNNVTPTAVTAEPETASASSVDTAVVTAEPETESTSSVDTAAVTTEPDTESTSSVDTAAVTAEPETEPTSSVDTAAVTAGPETEPTSSVDTAAVTAEPETAPTVSTSPKPDAAEGGASLASEGGEEGSLKVAELVIDDESSELASDITADTSAPTASELPETESLADEYVDIQTSDTIGEELDSDLSSHPQPAMVWSYSAESSEDELSTDRLNGLPDHPADNNPANSNSTQVTEVLPVPADSRTSSNSELTAPQIPEDPLLSEAGGTGSVSGDAEDRLIENTERHENIDDTADALPPDAEEITPDDFIIAAQDVPEGFEALVDRGGFTLHRAPTALTGIDPGLGTVSFALENAHAFYMQDAQPVSMEVLESRLEINFERQLFSTGLKLTHLSTGDVDFNASGSVETDGRFVSEEGDQILDGATTLDGQAAGYYFEKNLPGSESPAHDSDLVDSGTETLEKPDRKVQGITLWKAGQTSAPADTPPLTEAPLQP